MIQSDVDLSEPSIKLLNNLVPLCGLSSTNEVIENALVLLAWATEHRQNGLKISAIDLEHQIYKEIHMRALDGVRGDGHADQDQGRRL